ncbi:DUF3795 domain-containing protein [Proteinivorax hydrogeniformans]|uniref:DUF3795 domain-containing protein n=1 Tax=Proteinivorax hydrogeniformans TaxID=1826727 RepID=A0AAU8HSY1_9FIRM
MIESRCGILCSKCNYRVELDCRGCINIKKPFWGERCPVKSCCDSKKLNHCGDCRTFPCDLLKQFSYDEEQGDKGLRIEQCEKWKD